MEERGVGFHGTGLQINHSSEVQYCCRPASIFEYHAKSARHWEFGPYLTVTHSRDSFSTFFWASQHLACKRADLLILDGRPCLQDVLLTLYPAGCAARREEGGSGTGARAGRGEAGAGRSRLGSRDSLARVSPVQQLCAAAETDPSRRATHPRDVPRQWLRAASSLSRSFRAR